MNGMAYFSQQLRDELLEKLKNVGICSCSLVQ